MKTTSIYVSNLCIPCNCHCRYCLLSWANKTVGVDYERSVVYAKRFHEWMKKNQPDMNFVFYYGYSMEHPHLLESIDFMKSIGSPGGEFLQFDGMKFRDEAEIEELLKGIMEHGIKMIDLTFYGTREYHDRFAGRKGDFDYMLHILSVANRMGLPVEADIPLTQENVNQIEELVKILQGYELEKISLFVPHAEGRGVTLNAIRFRKEDFDTLGEEMQNLINTNVYRTEADWVTNQNFVVHENRALAISLTPENIEQFEQMDFEQTISYLEELDETYYQTIPTLEELVKLYGDSNNTEYYSQRDLYLKYQRRYIAEHHLDIYDVNDERQCFSRRY